MSVEHEDNDSVVEPGNSGFEEADLFFLPVELALFQKIFDDLRKELLVLRDKPHGLVSPDLLHPGLEEYFGVQALRATLEEMENKSLSDEEVGGWSKSVTRTKSKQGNPLLTVVIQPIKPSDKADTLTITYEHGPDHEAQRVQKDEIILKGTIAGEDYLASLQLAKYPERVNTLVLDYPQDSVRGRLTGLFDNFYSGQPSVKIVDLAVDGRFMPVHIAGRPRPNKGEGRAMITKKAGENYL